MTKFICDACGEPCELEFTVEATNKPTRCPFPDEWPSASWKEVEEIEKEEDSE